MGNFTLLDLQGIVWGFVFWCLLLLPAGFAIGYLTDVVSFRRCCFMRQVTFASLVAVAVVPIASNLLVMLGGLGLAVAAVCVDLIVVALVLWSSKPTVLRSCRHLGAQVRGASMSLAVQGSWFLLAPLLLLDIQIGRRLYLTMLDFDQGNLVAFTDGILRSGLPLINPTYFPGHQLHVFYHYYFELLCAVVAKLSGQVDNSRVVVIAGIICAGSAFLNCLCLASKYFKARGLAGRVTVLATLALVPIAALYGPIVILFKLMDRYDALYINNWTRDFITGSYVEIMTWTPHYVLALTAVIFGSVLILQSGETTDRRRRVVMVALSGLALASAAGLGTFVALGFGICIGLWSLISLCRCKFSDFWPGFCAGGLSLILSLPFLMQNCGEHQQASPLTISVRNFELFTDLFNTEFWYRPLWMQEMIKLSLLPANYLCGFGFILVGSLIYWQHGGQTLIQGRRQQFLVLMLIVGLLLGSFIRSKGTNVFGWRTMLLSNIALTLWAGQFLATRVTDKGSLRIGFANWSLLAIGLFTTLYGFYLERASSNRWYDSRRNFALRTIYGELNRRLPVDYVVQHGPRVALPAEGFAFLYSHRQPALSEFGTGIFSPVAIADWRRNAFAIERLFTGTSLEDALKTCARNQINVVLVKDTDKVWQQPSPWFGRFPVIAQNSYARAYLIHEHYR